MNSAPQLMVVHLPDHAPIRVNYFLTEDHTTSLPIVDLHLHFRRDHDGKDVQLTEAIQRKAAKQERLMQVIIAEIVQEYLHHRL
ncbi:MAG TPA: hypothetical protein VEX63_00980 [Flavisolibacter sp.]|jgi:hypothetical protein|nr:hypothetical protein [Flavisolibacter sp.]